MLRARLSAVLLGITFLGSVAAEVLPIRLYTTVDGLAADTINGILADSRGFLWFSTNEGLSRFDGYQFVTYGPAQGLPHRFIESMTESRSGDLWIGTPRGISRITAAGGNARFLNYPLEQIDRAYHVNAIVELRSGKLLIGTNAGLFESAADSSGALHFCRSLLPGAAELETTHLLEDSSGDLWVATTAGLVVYRGERIVQRIGVQDGLPGTWAQVLLRDSRAGIWVGVRGGLVRFRRNDGGDWLVDQVYGAGSELVGTDVVALHESSDGTVWVGTQFGISRLTWGNGGRPKFENLTRKHGLRDRAVHSFAEDQAGNLWAGTEHAGAMRIDRAGFITYLEQDGLTSDRVSTVFEDREGALLAVTSGATQKKSLLNVFDGTRFHSVSLGKFSDAPTWGWDRILLQSRAGEWWGATEHGLCRYGAGKPDDLRARAPRACYTDDLVFRIFEDSKGGIWASGQTRPGNRLIRWDPETNRILTFSDQKVGGIVPNELVSSFAEDRQGNIWMGLWVGGLYRYDGREFEHFSTADGVPSGTVYALFPQGESLWAGSNGGLARVQNTAEKKLRVEKLTTAQGLSSDTVFCIASDEQGRVYAGTAKGVDRFEPGTGHIRHFSAANGLARGALRSALRDRYGSLWFATTQGLSKLVSGAERSGAGPQVFITDLLMGGVVYPVSQVGAIRVGRLELTPSANQLQVDFVGLDYEPGDTLRYSYKLEGAGTDWTPPRSQHAVDFAALAAGSYRFLVKAVNADGLESAVPAEVDFTVLPPFWRRWWFELLAIAAVASVAYLLHTYRVSQMVGIEKMRTTIATDLHDDIGSNLSQIAVLSEVARAGVNGENRRTRESLERVAVLSRELVDSMGDIVWSIRAAPDGFDSLVARMREFALDLLVGQGIKFQLHSPETTNPLHVSLEARRHLLLMFKECLHNVSRHSGCTAVTAKLEVADQELLLTVEDNGSGFEAAEDAGSRAGGNGIPNIRRRAGALGGHVRFRSSPGQGCTVFIAVPLKRRRFATYPFE